MVNRHTLLFVPNPGLFRILLSAVARPVRGVIFGVYYENDTSEAGLPTRGRKFTDRPSLNFNFFLFSSFLLGFVFLFSFVSFSFIRKRLKQYNRRAAGILKTNESSLETNKL